MPKQTDKEAAVQTAEIATQEVSLLDKILTEGKMGRDEFQKERAKDMSMPTTPRSRQAIAFSAMISLSS